MGESAGCDVDCTAPSCGDGLRNALAGEACDTRLDTAGCDAADCTLPACGDNLQNFAVEDCDDGDAIDNGFGCSAECKFDNVCGDGVQQFSESCDDGGIDTALCDRDCSGVDCGDGHLNVAAGEECDDGNFDINDGCADCRRQ
jgi:cysteine-rich repeat protein